VAQKPRLAALAVHRGDVALRVVSGAMADGVIDANEGQRVMQALQDWHVVSKAANASQALGHALERGIADVHYLQVLVGGYQQIVDELPDEDEAA